MLMLSRLHGKKENSYILLPALFGKTFRCKNLHFWICNNIVFVALFDNDIECLNNFFDFLINGILRKYHGLPKH